MVRGMGVAVIVSTSTSVRHCLSFSLWATPKRCSSSMMTRPKSLKETSSDNRRCVPMMMSTEPLRRFLTMRSCCPAVRKRDNISTFTGNGARRSLKVLKCCCAKIVVGTRMATCLLSSTALKAARKATSVLPYPTSPQTNRSMGRGVSMSAFTSAITRSWSSVSRYGKLASNSACHSSSAGKAWPSIDSRAA